MRVNIVYHIGWLKKFLSTCLGAVLLASLLSGCAGNYGKLVYDASVDQIFEGFNVLPDHRYYIYGPDTLPAVIVALDKRYHLASSIWKPVDITKEKLKHWIDHPLRRNRRYPYTFGRRMLDDKGRQIGVWYALRDHLAYSVVWVLDDGTTVKISAPNERRHRRFGPRFLEDERHKDSLTTH